MPTAVKMTIAENGNEAVVWSQPTATSSKEEMYASLVAAVRSAHGKAMEHFAEVAKAQAANGGGGGGGMQEPLTTMSPDDDDLGDGEGSETPSRDESVPEKIHRTETESIDR
jgi:hypothetical protein